MARISVVVPVFNREKLIIRCLESILNQTKSPYEIIIVDNGSDDNTYDVVLEWIKKNKGSGIILKLFQEKTRGACQARQKGLENCDGDYISFFDSDDAMLPELIENVERKIIENASYDIICWKCKIKQLDGTIRVPNFQPKHPLEGHLIHTLLKPQGYVVRKEFLIKSGGWRKPVEVWNDYELGFRLLLNSPKIGAINKILSMIYSQEDSITGTDYSSKEGKWEATLKEMEEMNEAKAHSQKEYIRKILYYKKSILAAHYCKEGNQKAVKNIMREINEMTINERLIYKISYNLTKKGMRGVWQLARIALKK